LDWLALTVIIASGLVGLIAVAVIGVLLFNRR
jgi:hypothetical protein